MYIRGRTSEIPRLWLWKAQKKCTVFLSSPFDIAAGASVYALRMPYSPVQHRPETIHHRNRHNDRVSEYGGPSEALRLYWRAQMYRLTIVGGDGSVLQQTIRTETVWICPPRPMRERPLSARP